MVGIIPKPIKKPSKWQKYLPYVGVAFIIIVVLSYAAVFYFQKQTSTTLSDLEDKIASIGTKEEKDIETQLILSKKRIDDFSGIFKDHQQISPVFKFLGDSCHPKVAFTKMDLSPKDYSMSVAGEAYNFTALDQQLAAWRKNQLIKDFNLSDFSINDENVISFSVSFTLDPSLFELTAEENE
jgi:hypothetical protein